MRGDWAGQMKYELAVNKRTLVQVDGTRKMILALDNVTHEQKRTPQ